MFDESEYFSIMALCKRNKHKILSTKRWRCIIICYLLLNPSTCKAQPITVRTEVDNALNKTAFDTSHSNNPADMKANDTTSQIDSKQDQENQNLTLLVSFSITCIIITTLVLVLILGYLNNIPVAKQCLLLYLYKDVVKLTLLIQWNSFTYLILCYTTGNEMKIEPTPAKIIIYFGLMLVYQNMITLSVIGAIKFAMKKDMLLDPSMPWDDESNNGANSIMITRLAVIPFLLWLIMMLVSDSHPKLYYVAIGDHRASSKIPNNHIAMITIWGVLISLLFLTYIINLYQSNFNNSSGIGTSTRKLPNMSVLFGIKMIIGFISCFGMVLIGVEDRMWLIVQMCQVLMGLVLPTYTIWVTPPLRSYVKKKIGMFVEGLIINIIGPIRSAICHSSRIQPIESENVSTNE